MLRVLRVDQVNGSSQARLERIASESLPDGNVVVRVGYSSLNYKDALAVTGKGKVIRNFPMVPGIDLVGMIESSAVPAFRPGDPVLATGCGLGEDHWGGYSSKVRLKDDWLLPLPRRLSMQQSMALGTAGLTAMLSVMALEEHGLTPESGEILVTGAGGGVGGLTIALLARLGFRCTACSGRTELKDYLSELGACDLIPRETLTEQKKPLASERWAGAVDTVGGELLAGLLRSVAHGGSVATCGMAAGAELNTTVLPFILRGVNLLGIDSVRVPRAKRERAWQRLSELVSDEILDLVTAVISLGEVIAWSDKLLAGQIRGRVVVDVNA